ncbi:kinesin heavy chain [Pseudozyma hubeiensis SY62]|uniref:Kinesin heavy chain n=1 Tax=Pseudozyma hubeiensis (strain SY62) TaxID=1305764 RepID=R9P120_PSEHS|nr:kinesin heavy chain [Pseudozyma hubeiensis SY62]GAC94891.1 kinesin heavy chain [Pseudozyma hubeiensis SY62]
MSPAVTRATAATATAASSPSASSLDSNSVDDDRRSSTASIARQPFVPKRKPTKPAPYAYLLAEASASADSLPSPVLVQGSGSFGESDTASYTPARPSSAIETPLRTSPKKVKVVRAPSPQEPSRPPPRATRSSPRNFDSLSVDVPSDPAPSSAAAAPVLKTRSAFLTPAPPARERQAETRPRSHTPTTMAARTAAPPGTPKIKAAVSADVAARIRSPKKHASTSALRATANQSTPFSASSGLRSAHPLQQSSKDIGKALEAYAHSSSTWQHHTESSKEDADPNGDSSFVYDADADNAHNFGEANGQETVQVHVRLRPPKRGEECAWVANPYSGTVALEASIAGGRTQSANLGPFTFDGIQTGSANRPVYISVARPLVRAALDGYDAVVFAYGQTASGKTFTLSGDETGQEAGIIPRAVRDIFRGIKQSSARREYLLRASYLEIWNEVVKDLLEPSNVPQVRDDKRRRGGKGTTVQPLREEIVTSPAQVRELLARGQANRHVGATDWNERSSRSHTCFKITIESWERDQECLGGDPAETRLGKKVTVSELCLIDLAGSEKYVSQGSDRRTEGAHINKSLLTLGKVIYALSEKSSAASAAGSAGVHIPYRDSKLTRILQNSLSGNARVAVVCTINPNPSAVDESLSTLNFAKRIKKVGLNARRNEVDGSLAGGIGAEAQALILRYQTEADALRKMVDDLSRTQKVEVEDDRIRELQERLDVIGSLVVRGGRSNDADDVSDDESSAAATNASRTASSSSTSTTAFASSNSSSRTTSTTFARPVSPMKRSYNFGFDDPPHLLAEKLFLANRKIETLSRKLASRPSLPATSIAQAELISSLQQQVKELEMVCEAQATDAPPKIREDVEREFASGMAQLRSQIEEKDEFIKELQEEGARLRRVNEKLMQLAHRQTQDMVENLSPTRTRSPLNASDVGNAAVRRLEGGKKARPMSLFNPPSGMVDFSSALKGTNSILQEEAASGGAKSGAPILAGSAVKRRSISNDYTLLQLGTGEIEEEILQKSARIPASETFAVFPS